MQQQPAPAAYSSTSWARTEHFCPLIYMYPYCSLSVQHKRIILGILYNSELWFRVQQDSQLFDWVYYGFVCSSDICPYYRRNTTWVVLLHCVVLTFQYCTKYSEPSTLWISTSFTMLFSEFRIEKWESELSSEPRLRSQTLTLMHVHVDSHLQCPDS